MQGESRISKEFNVLAVVVLVVVAGCSLPNVSNTNGENGSADRTPVTASPTESSLMTPTPGNAESPDQPGDQLGWEDGYWYNATLSLTPEDGYNRTELDRIVARTMARLEVIRRLEFTDSVFVGVISREEFRERNTFEFDPDPYRDQIYEALFLVGEDARASERLELIYKGGVGGYYTGTHLVIVSDNPDAMRINRTVLTHELVHALQDDQFQTGNSATTFDGRRAARGLSEGEANYVMDRYHERCASGWECVPRASQDTASRPANPGLALTVQVPYSEGPTLVGELVDRGGWRAVDRAHERPPVSTEQLIHPETYPDETPAVVRIENRSNEEWQRFGNPVRDGHERVGEAALYAMFWQNGVIPEDHLETDEVRNNYSHPFTDGWNGDALVPYRNGDRFGYVFVTRWDTERDARQFHTAYLELLDERDARQVTGNVFVIPDDAFGDAFRVVHRGNRVVIINGPTVEDVDEIHTAPAG